MDSIDITISTILDSVENKRAIIYCAAALWCKRVLSWVFQLISAWIASGFTSFIDSYYTTISGHLILGTLQVGLSLGTVAMVLRIKQK